SDPFSIHFEQRCFGGIDSDLMEGTWCRLIGKHGHLHETCRFFACSRGGGSDLRIGLEERINDERIVKRAATLNHDCKGLLRTESWPVGSIRRQCVETVDYRKDSSSERNVCTRDSRRIPVTIPMFMMVSHDPHD